MLASDPFFHLKKSRHEENEYKKGNAGDVRRVADHLRM
jgi:hypothetical protein